MATWNYKPEEMIRYAVGDVLKWSDGKRYLLTKKTSTSVAMQRYFWFDAVGDWLRRKFGQRPEVKG